LQFLAKAALDCDARMLQCSGDRSVPTAVENVLSSTHEGVFFFMKNTAVLRFPTATASGPRNRGEE